MVLNKIKANEIYCDAQEDFGQWSKENKILRSIVKENHYALVKILSKTVFAGKV